MKIKEQSKLGKSSFLSDYSSTTSALVFSIVISFLVRSIPFFPLNVKTIFEGRYFAYAWFFLLQFRCNILGIAKSFKLFFQWFLGSVVPTSTPRSIILFIVSLSYLTVIIRLRDIFKFIRLCDFFYYISRFQVKSNDRSSFIIMLRSFGPLRNIKQTRITSVSESEFTFVNHFIIVRAKGLLNPFFLLIRMNIPFGELCVRDHVCYLFISWFVLKWSKCIMAYLLIQLVILFLIFRGFFIIFYRFITITIQAFFTFLFFAVISLMIIIPRLLNLYLLIEHVWRWLFNINFWNSHHICLWNIHISRFTKFSRAFWVHIFIPLIICLFITKLYVNSFFKLSFFYWTCSRQMLSRHC